MAVSQTKLQALLLDSLKKSEHYYQKFRTIQARIAKEAEEIITVLDDIKETSNTANAGDYIVKNLTHSEETYIVPREKFPKLYTFSKTLDDTWSEYQPKGRVQALAVTPELLSRLKQTSPFSIVAPWGEKQRVEINDYLVTPLPNQNEIYRVSHSAFKDTYQPVKSS